MYMFSECVSIALREQMPFDAILKRIDQKTMQGQPALMPCRIILPLMRDDGRLRRSPLLDRCELKREDALSRQ